MPAPAAVAPAPLQAGTQPPAWKPWVGIAALVMSLFGAAVLGAILIIATGNIVDGKIQTEDLPSGVLLGSLVLQDLAFLAGAVGVASLMARPKPWHFGWRPVRAFWPAVGWSALLYVGFILFTAVFLTVLGKADEKDTIAQDLGADSSTAAAVAVALLVAVGAPVVEELLFRGVLFGGLRQRWPVLPAAAVTGVLFGAVHVGGSPIAFLLPLALLGFGLCLLYHRTGSLYPPMAVHAVNNSVAIVGALDWKLWLMPVVTVGSLACIAALAAVVRSMSDPVPADAPSP